MQILGSGTSVESSVEVCLAPVFDGIAMLIDCGTCSELSPMHSNNWDVFMHMILLCFGDVLYEESRPARLSCTQLSFLILVGERPEVGATGRPPPRAKLPAASL